MNRQVAEAKAKIIESDIALERFDRTLKKYTSPYAPDDSPPLIQIWDQYAEWKRPQIAASTFTRDYRKTRNHILKLPTQAIARATEIRDWLGANLSPDASRRCLTQIKAACNWASDEGIIAANPFLGLNIRERKQKPKRRSPFSTAERDAIIAAFERDHPHYVGYVRFLFLTGCRTSEANGLRWDDVKADAIIFSHRLIEKKESDGLKSQDSRRFPINGQLRSLLETLPRTGDYVFTSPTGFLLDSHNFLNRVWKPTLKAIAIPYRDQYSTRHTFITQCLARGIPVATIAQWVGNKPETIYKHYAAANPDDAPPEF